MKLSIILPTYNVEKYIAKCLYSLLDQDLDKREYEILVINDGTKDRSAQIAREIAEQHDNIHVFDKENGGVSSARNMGIDVAKGEYLFFVDPDDSIEPNVLKMLFDKCKASELDILAFSYRYVNEEGVYSVPDYQIRLTPDKLFTGIEYLLTNQYTVMVCMNFYRTAYLRSNNLRFIICRYEDEEFTVKALYFCKRILYMEMPIYNYLIHSDSFMNKNPQANVFDYLKIAESLKNFALSGAVKEPDVLRYLDKRLNYYFITAIDRANSLQLKMALLDEVIRQGFWTKHSVKRLRRKYKTLIKHPRLCRLYYQLQLSITKK